MNEAICIVQKKRVLPSSVPSSAMLLARELNIKCIGIEDYKSDEYDCVINWGLTSEYLKSKGITLNAKSHTLINDPNAVSVAVNKLKALRAISKTGADYPYVGVIPFCTDMTGLEDWTKVVCRHLLKGSCGRGIEIVDARSQLIPNAPLYTKYIRNRIEFRVHVLDNEVMHIQRKIRLTEENLANFPERSKQIRNMDNGWVYSSNINTEEDMHIDYTTMLTPHAKHAVMKLLLDFGAVDLIVPINRRTKEPTDEPMVLEVNTAPGLKGTTLNRYYSYLHRLIKDDYFGNEV